MTHYDTLEIHPRASAEVVRAAYRSLIQRWHPDRHAGDRTAADRAAAVNEAYEVLSDAGRRAAYDAFLAASSSPDPARSGPRRAARAVSDAGKRSPVLAHRSAAAVLTLAALAVAGFAVWMALPGSSSPLSHRQAGELRVGSDPRQGQRTVELLDAPLVLSTRARELTLPRLQVVLGSVDTVVVRTQLRQRRDRWQWTLEQRVADEDAAVWHGVAGEARMRELVAQVLNETLGTRPEQAHAPTAVESPGRSGVIEVSLPEGLSVSPTLVSP